VSQLGVLVDVNDGGACEVGAVVILAGLNCVGVIIGQIVVVVVFIVLQKQRLGRRHAVAHAQDRGERATRPLPVHLAVGLRVARRIHGAKSVVHF